MFSKTYQMIKSDEEGQALVEYGLILFLVSVANRARVADRICSRLLGLMWRRRFGPEDALALSPVGSVHTFFMRMPIDVIFLDGAGMVLGVRRSLPPWRIAAGGTRARQTLELPGGTVRRLRLQPGDHLEFEPVPA